ncbi:MAG: adenylate/guanylate cyclase domain-containing protein [Elusimicrobiota bacterium]
MIELAAGAGFSFVWRADAGRWLLEEGEAGKKALPVSGGPFRVGRSPDCELVLPHSEELCLTTSRWHCYLVEAEGRWLINDGSLNAVPETGLPKPSISGTFLNGRRLWQSAALQEGDLIRIGPWECRVEGSGRKTVDIDRLLKRIGEESPLDIESDRGSKVGFESLDELFTKLYRIKDNDESLAAILSFSMEKISAAQVAAVITFAPDGTPSVRSAWQRGAGRLLDFRFSSGLLSALPADRAFLLKSEIQDGTKSQTDHKISSGLLVPLRGREERLGVLYMDNRNHGGSFREEDLYLANALANVASLQLALERQTYLTHVEQNMTQYFGPDVVRLIVEYSRQGKPVSLGVKEIEATVFFVDIQAFSQFCRGRSPLEVSELLNPYFEMAASAIQAHGGHVDKFMGDGVMGVFGAAPVQDPRLTRANHADHPTQAVLAGRQLIAQWEKWSRARWGAALALRIGISTGRLVIGNIGFPGRIEYSALGDTVNLASRMEHLALPNGIAICDATRRRLGGAFECVDGGEEDVRGLGLTKVWRLAGS